MVIEQLGHDPFRADGDRRVTVTLSRTDAGFQGRITWTDARGRPLGDRLLSSRGRDCREIAANVAFAVALQLQLVERGAPRETTGATSGSAPAPKTGDETQRTRASSLDRPDAPPERSSTERSPSPDLERREAPEAAPSQPAGEPPASPPASGSAERLHLAIGLGPAVAAGLMPDATAFGRMFISARFHRFSAEIAEDAGLPATVIQKGGGTVRLTPLGSSAAGCAHLAAASACLLGRFGWLRARGTGVDRPATSWGRFTEVGLRLAASRELGRVVLSVHADGLVMLSRWNVLLNDSVVWRVPRVGGLLGLDVALRFF
jgi:hypothetical protein